MPPTTRARPPRAPSLSLDDLPAVEDRDALVPGGHLDGVELAGTDLSGRRLVDLTDAAVARLALAGCRVDVVDLAVACAKDLDLRGSGVATLNGVRSLDGVVLDEDQARWFGPLLAAKLGARVL